MEETQIIALNLTLKQVNVLLLCMGKQPLEVVLETFAAVREQTEKQIKADKPELGGAA